MWGTDSFWQLGRLVQNPALAGSPRSDGSEAFGRGGLTGFADVVLVPTDLVKQIAADRGTTEHGLEH